MILLVRVASLTQVQFVLSVIRDTSWLMVLALDVETLMLSLVPLTTSTMLLVVCQDIQLSFSPIQVLQEEPAMLVVNIVTVVIRMVLENVTLLVVNLDLSNYTRL